MAQNQRIPILQPPHLGRSVGPRADPSASDSTPRFAWAVSITFWATLVLAGGLYAAIALSPKLQVWIRLQADYRANHLRLVELEDQVEHLRNVADALEHDPQFALELARIDFGAIRPGDERITVEADLRLDAQTRAALPVARDGRLPWYAAIVDRFATNDRVRMATLAIVTVLILVAFTLLHDQYETTVRSIFRAIGSGLGTIAGRYRQSLPDDL